MDREFIYKIFARTPRDPNVGFFLIFFMTVLSPGRCLDGSVPHFSCRYIPSDTRFTILNLKSSKFYAPSTFPELPKTLPKLSQAPLEPPLGRTGAREGFGSILERPRALKYEKYQLVGDFWNTATGAWAEAEVVARSAARSPSPYATGARMMVVTLTLSN